MALIKIISTDRIPKERRYAFNDKFEDIEENFLIDESEINISEPILKDGILYSPCQISNTYAVCKTFEFKEDIDHEYTSEIVCPYCGHEVMDSWDMGDSSDSEICSICGSEFAFERNVTVDYISNGIKKNEVKEII